ncbi:Retrovirus-related Pol polyprotein from transposon TNT 1-94 [Vitis vinifera]|uniref:Retrovirus-related Pol polyprotein from transposon TNT 1-94 n=1 Tax=Vitis vinifera TaxID=29760 RepID=A0A438C6R6_VITVI|nr:Retrovirus-related Pol polyprotein from transposon TNT 1-94 [Vitis vinifera]
MFRIPYRVVKPKEANAKSKGYRFYCPSHSTRIVESRNAKFLKNDLISGSDRFQDVVCERDHIDAQPSTLIDQVVQDPPKIVEQPVEQHDSQENVDTTLRRFTKQEKAAIPSDYVVYLQESDYNIRVKMILKRIWNLVELPNGAKSIGCKWVFKTKKDSLGNIESLFNGNLEEEVYMKQLKGFSSSSGEHLGNRFNLDQCPKNDLEREQIKNIPYVSTVGSLMYAQVCTRPVIAFVVGMLGRYQSNLGINHWKVAKKVMRYRQGTKDYMLMYRRTDNLEVISYSDSDYVGYIDSRTSTSGYVFMLTSGDVSWRSAK